MEGLQMRAEDYNKKKIDAEIIAAPISVKLWV